MEQPTGRTVGLGEPNSPKPCVGPERVAQATNAGVDGRTHHLIAPAFELLTVSPMSDRPSARMLANQAVKERRKKKAQPPEKLPIACQHSTATGHPLPRLDVDEILKASIPNHADKERKQ